MDKDTIELLRQATIRKDKLISEQRFDEAGQIRDLINGINGAEKLKDLLGLKEVKPAELFLVADPDGNIHAGEDGDGYPWVLIYDSKEEAEKTLKYLNGIGDVGRPISVHDPEYRERKDFSKYRVIRYVSAAPEAGGAHESSKRRGFIERSDFDMKTSHEAQVEIRDLLPVMRHFNEILNNLFGQTVGMTGPQGVTGPESDVSYAYQYLDGAKNMLMAIADHFGLPLPDRTDAKARAAAQAWRHYTEIDRRLAEDRNGSCRPKEERERDASEVGNACEAYKKELEKLVKWIL